MRIVPLPAVVIACATWIIACGSRDHGPAPEIASADAGSGGRGYVCRMTAMPDPGASLGPLIGIVDGPHGTRIVGEHGWWDAGGIGSVRYPGIRGIAWTGSEYLVTDGVRTLAVVDDSLEHGHVVRTLPAGTCGVSVTEIPGGAAVLYNRVARGVACHDEAPGVAMFQRFADGQLDRTAVTLDDAADKLRIAARWDAGRLTVQAARISGLPAWWVLSASGEVLARGDGARGVACPRAGCMSIADGAAVSDTPADNNAATLGVRLVALATMQPRFVPVDADHATAMAVHGDRILFVVPRADVDYEPSVISIYDAARRVLLPIIDVDGSRESVRTTLRPRPETIRLAQTPDGFLLASVPPDAPPFVRRIECAL